MKKSLPPSHLSLGAGLLLLLSLGLTFRALAQEEAQPKYTIHMEPQQITGVMLGGIGTGFLELQPDGCIHDWSIFNRGAWAYQSIFIAKDPRDRQELTDVTPDSWQFYIRTKASGSSPVLRRLNVAGDQTDLYNNTWLQCVESIDYDPTFPGATLRYNDHLLPVKVTGQFYSPVIPHHMQVAGTPGAYVVFTIKNTSAQSQEVSLASYLRNPLGFGGNKTAEARKLRTEMSTVDGTTYLAMNIDEHSPVKSTLGSMCLSIEGGKPSWIAMDFGKYLLGDVVRPKVFGARYESPLRDFRETGNLPTADQSECPALLVPAGGEVESEEDVMNANENADAAAKKALAQAKDDISKFTDEQVADIIAKARKIPSLNSIVEEAQLTDPTQLDPKKGGRDFVHVLGQVLNYYAGKNRKALTWGDGMLATKLTLKPGEEKQVRVVLSWYFPNHSSPDGTYNMGHMYNNWFKNALEVNRFLVKNATDFGSQVNAFRTILRDSTLPTPLMEAVSIQMNTLIASSWWTQNNKTGIWEGTGSCGLNTVDVSFQGSHPLISLFPEFERIWTRNSANFQNEQTSHLYHTQPSNLDMGGKNNSFGKGFGYIDVNCHFPLMIYRDYLWSGSRDDLAYFYPHVIKALSVFESLDSDGDGLPDHDTGGNTYDSWMMRGTPAYISSLWISALRAGIKMADAMGDKANSEKWNGILQKALKNFDPKLWNGEYYNLWVDGDTHDEACMTDQLSGEMYAKLIGMGNGLPPERVKQVLAAVYKYNFTPDGGLLNGSYPPGKKPRLPTYRNRQGDGNWSGIEYAAAAMMFDQGMVDQAVNVIAAVDQRYDRAGQTFKHEECGAHYYRPMSIWAALLAATGFKINTPEQMLTIAPVIKQDKLKAPWVSYTGWGEFTKTGSSFSLACLNGETSFKTFRTNVPGLKKATLAGDTLDCKIREQDGLTVIEFAKPVTVKTGQTLALQ